MRALASSFCGMYIIIPITSQLIPVAKTRHGRLLEVAYKCAFSKDSTTWIIFSRTKKTGAR